MKKNKNTGNNLIDAYKRVRKPVAPPGQVLPDKRDKLKDLEALKDLEDLKKRENQVRATAFVSGHVQGVYFRALAQEQAEAAGLTGWVRNRVDGRVEVVLEGDKEAVQTVIDWLHIGPPSARVERVEVFWENAANEFSGFNQKHTF